MTAQFNQIQPDLQPADPRIEGLRKGQKLLLFGLLLLLLIYVLTLAMPVIMRTFPNGLPAPVGILIVLGLLLTFLSGLLCSIVGLFNTSQNLGHNVFITILLCLLVFLPLIGLITLALVNERATRKLKAHGYKVGLMGANPKTA